jgi:molybdenum cofactor cytidylyltransferase
MSQSNSNISVVILAAGASRRMGTPKQLLPWGKSTLLEHTINEVLKLKIKETVVVLGANYDIIEKKINQCGVTILYNSDWQMGLGKSIACAAKYLVDSKPDVDGMLVLLADQPFINDWYLNTLLQEFEAKNYQIVATSYGDQNHGVPVIFDKAFFLELSNLEDDKGAKHLLNGNTNHLIGMTPSFKNVDLDSKEEYEAIYTSNH